MDQAASVVIATRKAAGMRSPSAKPWSQWLLFSFFSLVWIIADPAQAYTATAGAVLQTPERYDKQSVTLAGTVMNLDQRVSQRGNAYYTFDLQDATGRIRVFSFGQAACPEGKQAVVDGTFEAVKRLGRYTFYNEVTASRVTCR